jgi:hypothetical protein
MRALALPPAAGDFSLRRGAGRHRLARLPVRLVPRASGGTPLALSAVRAGDREALALGSRPARRRSGKTVAARAGTGCARHDGGGLHPGQPRAEPAARRRHGRLGRAAARRGCARPVLRTRQPLPAALGRRGARAGNRSRRRRGPAGRSERPAPRANRGICDRRRGGGGQGPGPDRQALPARAGQSPANRRPRDDREPGRARPGAGRRRLLRPGDAGARCSHPDRTGAPSGNRPPDRPLPPDRASKPSRFRSRETGTR